ncbi:MAG: SpoIIE family protein phosphatase [Microscillaceae bacterium]|nr:SpoIIE family protein phosphatase [Microscillaceae bacterium]MDW8460510.1 SpoIIE family protein phosphatase [Cytophagales bacterium]
MCSRLVLLFLGFYLLLPCGALSQFKITGKVSTEDGLPINDVKVSVNGSPYAVTERTGRFSLDVQQRFSKPTNVKIFKKGYKLKNYTYSENQQYLNIILQPATSLRGKVLNYQNKPVANAKVDLNEGESSAVTNELGEFTLPIPENIQISLGSKFKVNDIPIALNDVMMKENYSFVYLKMPKPAEEEKPIKEANQVVKIRLFDQQKRPLPNVSIYIDGVLYQSNAQAWVNLKNPAFRFSQFKFDKYEISEQEYMADTEILNIYLKPIQTKPTRESKDNYAKDFDLIEDELKSQREFQVQKTSILKRELEQLTLKLAAAKLEEEQRKILQEYLAKIEKTFYENDEIYQKLQREAKNSLEEMRAAILARDSINLAAERKIKQITQKSEEDKRLANLRYRTTVTIASIIVASLLIIALILYLIGRRIKRQKDEIEKIKNELAEKVVQIAQQKEDILQKSKALEEAYTQIQYSILSAQRIQQSILYKPQELLAAFQDGFIIFKPKDIVSGDFYWFSNKGLEIVLVAADCTGHGVPGAFMTMLGHSLLNQIINENNITNPAEVISLLDLKIQTLLHQQVYEKGGSTEGMDLAMIVIHKIYRQATFAGAKLPIYISQKGVLSCYPGTNATIGGSVLLKKNKTNTFENQTIDLQGGEIIYLASDGFQDQFGGTGKKKYMKTRFKELLESIQHKPIAEQKEALLQEFDAWKGSNPQVDDVLLIGVKL